MSKRLAMLEKMTAAGATDPFAWYGLALEYKGLGRFDDALSTFEKLYALDPSYVAQYLMCGSMLAEQGRTSEARTWLERGVEAAKKKGDSHALSEIQGALDGLG